MRFTKAVRILPAALLLIAATPGSAGDVELNAACDNGGDLPVVTVDSGVSAGIDTPVGAVLSVQSVDGGDYLVDLEGLEVGQTKTVNVVVSWTNGVVDDASDYDMYVDGVQYQAVAATEEASITASHCQVISVDEVYAFTGTPADSLTVDVSISQWGF